MPTPYHPIFTITPRQLNLVGEIRKRFGRLVVGFDFDHCYGFYDNLKRHWKSNEEYTLFADLGEDAKPDDPGVESTRVDLAFKPEKKMLFLFDYGDDWFFEVTCTGEEEAKPFKEPKILSTAGKAPIQYPDCDE